MTAQTRPPSVSARSKGTESMIQRPDEDPLLDVKQAAALLGTSERFPRRLIADRRIRFVRVGRFVRIPMSALTEFMEPVEPMTAHDAWRAA
ncbi:helix-turn-helix domain-containing protein [Actinopolymorpha sp. B9G3]|uniref:helix-turn-helix domain-containing protein n=1 Tax=Actinopolymorpha sp. B9G3 TaxID=3158970 RepID=UPI0032D95D05